MRNATRNITTAIMLVSLSFGVIGIPLYQHICAEMGVAELFSTCTMHERETHDFSCCSERSSQPTKQKLDGVECCYEIDATKQIHNAFEYQFRPTFQPLRFTVDNSVTDVSHSFLALRSALYQHLHRDHFPPGGGENTYLFNSSFLI